MIDSRPLGRTGVPLTILGCGTGTLARPERGDAAEAAAAATLEAAWAAGVRYFDTAPSTGSAAARAGSAPSWRRGRATRTRSRPRSAAC